MKFVRAKDGAIFGVCKGLARTLDIPVGVFRLIWLLSILALGTGIGVYLLLAITLPREDKTAEALQPWILGVCAKISQRSQLEVGIVRFLTIILSFVFMGATIIGYIVLYFVLDDKRTQVSGSSSSTSNPSTPPSTT